MKQCAAHTPSKVRPWAMDLSGSSKRSGRIFESFDAHLACSQSSPVMYVYSDSAMSVLSCTHLCKWCLPSFASPSFCTVQFLCNNSIQKGRGGEGWLTSRVGQVESLWEKELIYFQMTKLEVATAFYKNCASYRPFEHINHSITFEPSYFLLFHLGQQLIHCLPLCFKMEIHIRTECKSSPSREVIFQCFQLTDTFSNHKLASKWELDVVWRTQLASFPANQN